MTIFYRVNLSLIFDRSKLYRTNRELQRSSQHFFKALLARDDAFLHIVKLLKKRRSSIFFPQSAILFESYISLFIVFFYYLQLKTKMKIL